MNRRSSLHTVAASVTAFMAALIVASVLPVRGAEAPAESPTTTSDDGGLAVHHRVGEFVHIFESAELAAGERAETAVTVFGDAKINGEVDDQCVTVFGDLELNGRVGGDLVVVMGNATLGPNAVIEGECVVVGGRINADPQARIDGQKVEVAGFLPNLKPLGRWLTSGLLWGRLVVPSLGWVWVVVALHFLVYFIIAVLIPRPVEACERALDTQPFASFGVGLLALILSGPAVVILVASGVGLLVVPFLWLAFIAAILIGKTASFQWIGRSLTRRFNPEAKTLAIVGFLLGFVIVTILYIVPILGLVLWGILLPLGLGAAVMALVTGIRQSRPIKPQPPAVPVSAVPPLTATAAPGPTGAVASGEVASTSPAAVPSAPALQSAAEFAVMPRAGFWIRFAATLLDLILLGWLLAWVDGVFVFLWGAYHVGMWTWKGTTIGGIVCGLKVIRLDGRPLDFTVALVRALAAVFSFVAFGLGFFWAGWSSDKQSWHDKIAGTVIVRVPRGVSLI